LSSQIGLVFDGERRRIEITKDLNPNLSLVNV